MSLQSEISSSSGQVYKYKETSWSLDHSGDKKKKPNSGRVHFNLIMILPHLPHHLKVHIASTFNFQHQNIRRGGNLLACCCCELNFSKPVLPAFPPVWDDPKFQHSKLVYLHRCICVDEFPSEFSRQHYLHLPPRSRSRDRRQPLMASPANNGEYICITFLIDLPSPSSPPHPFVAIIFN